MMDPRQLLLRLGWAQTLLWVGLALAVNHLASAVPLRWDLTADQRHSLSDVSRDSVSGLERPLLARVYFSEGLEAPYHDHRQALLDLLDELSTAAGGRLRVEVVDPTGDAEAVSLAASDGVRPIPYAFRAWDRTESRTVFMGVSLVYGERRVAVDALPAVERMEAEVVGAIRRVTQEPEDTPSVGWWLGHGEPDPTRTDAGIPLTQLVSRLSKRGPFRTVAPGDAPFPEDLDALLVVAPRSAPSPAELVHLDQFLMRGGALMVWLSSVQPDFEAGRPVPVDHGLGAWLGHHGVRVNRDVLLDRDHAERMVVPAQVEGLGRQWVAVTYPLALVTTNLERTARPVRDLQRVVLPFASSVALANPLPDTVEGQIWVRTLPEAKSVRDLTTLDPRQLRAPLAGETDGPHPVVVALQGRFRSWASSRPLPPRLDPKAPPFDVASLRSRGEPSRLVVVGSGDALANNLDLAANALDWMLDDPALIDVRARVSQRPPLTPPPRAAALRAKVLVTGLPLFLLALIAGMIRLRRAR